MKLYTFPALHRSQKVLIAAELAGVKIDVDTTATEEQILAKTVFGKVPVLETPEGNLGDANAIVRYIARKAPAGNTLNGRDAFEHALVDSWIEFCASELEVPASMWLAPVIGWMELDKQVEERAKLDFKRGLQTLEAHLKTETFLVGRQVTLADVAVVTTLLLPFTLLMDAPAREAFPNVMRWFLTCAHQQAFVDVIGEVKLCVKPAVPAAKAAAPKPAAAAKPAAKAAPAAAAAPKRKQDDEDAALEEAAPAPKKVNPLDALPKSNFVLDAWKREYSNAKNTFDAMDYFWKNHDNEGYSVWFCDHKYDDELKVVFMTSNLIGGFMQRSEEVRKYAFGVMQILGDDSAQKVVGAWLMRGQSMDPLIQANEMAENFIFTKVDVNSEDDKKKLAAIWCEGDNLDVAGTKYPILDCKVFK